MITYSIESAIHYYQLDSSLVIFVPVWNFEELEKLTNSGISSKNVVALVWITEPEPDPALYKALHERGISCILGTTDNLDRKAETRQAIVYVQLVKNGANILSSDKLKEASQAIEELIPNKNPKKVIYKE